MHYQYVAYTEDGILVRGSSEAASAAAVQEMLWDNHYYIAKIQEVAGPTNWRAWFPSLFGVHPDDVVALSRQLAVLIRAGIAVTQAVELLQEQVPNPTLRDEMQQVAHLLTTGESFSGALARFPAAFPPLFCQMIAVGERTGRLDVVLDRVATHLEVQQSARRRVQGALAYPAFVLVLATGVVTFLVNFAVPSTVGLFREFNVPLPWSTKLLLWLTDALQRTGGLLAVTAAAAVVLGFARWRTPAGRRQFDQMVLRLPVVGAIVVKSTMAGAARTISILLRAGIPLPDTLDLTIATVGNHVIREALARARMGLLQGHGLAVPLGQEPLVPRLVVQMVKVGEEAGSLDVVLDTLAQFYEQDTDRSITAATSKIQPVLMLVMGTVVGFLAIATLTPISSLVQGVR